ncbi:hypothetical protein AYI68_g6590, partial [Smittium mucronatum]
MSSTNSGDATKTELSLETGDAGITASDMTTIPAQYYQYRSSTLEECLLYNQNTDPDDAFPLNSLQLGVFDIY